MIEQGGAELGKAVEDDCCLSQRIPVGREVRVRDGDDVHTRRVCSAYAGRRILEYGNLPRWRAEATSGLEKHIRVGLPLAYVIGGNHRGKKLANAGLAQRELDER